MTVDNVTPIAPRGLTPRLRDESSLAQAFVEEVRLLASKLYVQDAGLPPRRTAILDSQSLWVGVTDHVLRAIQRILTDATEPVGYTIDRVGGWVEVSGAYKLKPVVVHLLWRTHCDTSGPSVIDSGSDLIVYAQP